MEPSCPQQQIAYEYILYWSSSHPHRCFPQPVPVVLISMSSLEETQTKNPNSLGICLFVCFLGLLQKKKKHKLGALEQQKWIVSQFWRLEVQNQGVGRAMLLQSLREGSFLASSSFCLKHFLACRCITLISVSTRISK